MEPKFLEYMTDLTATTDNGFEYKVLSEEAPQELLEEYEEYIQKQDDLMAEDKPVLY